MDTDLIPAAQMKHQIPRTTDQSWAAMRHKGTGPRYVKLGRRVYYRRADIDGVDRGQRLHPHRPSSRLNSPPPPLPTDRLRHVQNRLPGAAARRAWLQRRRVRVDLPQK